MEARNTTEKVTKKNVLEAWATQYPEVTRWLSKLQRREQAALFLYRFSVWTKKTPQELLAIKELDSTVSPPANAVEKLLDDFCATADLKNSEKYNVAITVKSFFKHSYRSLEKASGSVSYEKVKDYNALSKEGLRKLYNRALNPRDRVLVPFVTCTGIAKETLTNLTWGHLEADWEKNDLPCINIGPELLKGHGKGKYKDVRQVTFLTPEAKRELLNYRSWMEEKLGRKLTPKDHIWLETYKPYNPLEYGMLGQVFRSLSRNAGVPFSAHDGRRWITTALEQIGISSNWARKIRGRKVRGEEAPYSRPAIEQLRAKFKEAVSILEFTTELPTVPKEVQEKLAALEAEQLRIKKEYGLVRQRAKKQLDKDDCPDGSHCQKIVTEENLGEFLSQGFRVVATLASGKVVVDR